MNKADYRMVGWFCIIPGWVLTIISIAINIIVGSELTQSGTSVLLSFYAYSTFSVYGGIILLVISIGFFLRARQER